MLGDLLSFAGVSLGVAIVAYGGWLCLRVAVSSPARSPADAEEAQAALLDAAPADGSARHSEKATRIVVGLLVAGTLATQLARPYAAPSASPLDLGLEAYQGAKYSVALAQFALAAQRGNGRAQEILAFMHLHGQSLYGAAVPQDRKQAIYWFRRAAEQGHEVAQHMLCVLIGQPAATVIERASCAALQAQTGVAPGSMRK